MPTKLQVMNLSCGPVDVYLTLGLGLKGYIEDVYGIFGLTNHGPKGKITLHKKGDYVEYVPVDPVKAIKGNLAFGDDAKNCRTIDSPDGINLFEFNLNNYNLGTPENETIDISDVPGINAFIMCELEEGAVWNSNPDIPEVTFFYNSFRGDNVGKVGVFPIGCPECTFVGDPVCDTDPLKPETPQKTKMCTVQRPSSADACNGIVRVLYFGKVKPGLNLLTRFKMWLRRLGIK